MMLFCGPQVRARTARRRRGGKGAGGRLQAENGAAPVLEPAQLRAHKGLTKEYRYNTDTDIDADIDIDIDIDMGMAASINWVVLFVGVLMVILGSLRGEGPRGRST